MGEGPRRGPVALLGGTIHTFSIWDSPLAAEGNKHSQEVGNGKQWKKDGKHRGRKKEKEEKKLPEAVICLPGNDGADPCSLVDSPCLGETGD